MNKKTGVKIFQDNVPELIEDHINKFIDENNINIIDIKTSESDSERGYSYTALLMYEVKE